MSAQWQEKWPEKWQELLAEVSLKPLSHEPVDLFISPLTCHGVISLHGEQSESYLQGQLTNDIATLQDNDYLMNAHCDPKGKMWSISRLVKQDDHYFLIAGLQESQASLKELQKYGVFAKTDIIDASQTHLVFAIGGDNASDFISQHQLPAIALKGPLSGNYLLMLSADNAAEFIAEHQNALYEPSQWHKTSIVAGVASLDQHSTNQYVPQMLNLQALDAISFSKGCYTGQEMVARMKYLGKNKRAAYIVSGNASSNLNSGDELQLAIGENWRRGGAMINVAGDKDKFYALAILANDLDADSILRVNDDEHSTINILPLPYSLEDTED